MPGKETGKQAAAAWCCQAARAGLMLIATLPFAVGGSALAQQGKKPAPAPAAKAPASAPHPSAAGARPSTATAGHATAAGAPTRLPGVTRDTRGNTVTRSASGTEVVKNPSGRVTEVKTANGAEARFSSTGRVREVRANGMTVHQGPGGVRRTEFERPDHSRLVAEGHGRGYIQRPYSYGGHTYYSRAYYYHGGYYRAYYRGYYYNGVYLNGYMPAYYYPPAYYGWAYTPWAAPVAYGWGWAGSPWYGYYGGYFAPYPVYPSAAYWLTDYMISNSLQSAYAAGYAAGSGNARLEGPPNRSHASGQPHLLYASYEVPYGAPGDATAPAMTKDVKDAIAEEIQRELAAQKAAGAEANTANLAILLEDGKPHVFVASSGITVSSAGEECALTEGDVLRLAAPPAKDASTADLQVLASKQNECGKGATVAVDTAELQEMYNSLLAGVDKGLAEMKDHPGQGGLPTPPADAIAGVKEAPYASAAPAADPNGGAELDQQAQQGAQVEQQVVAEATASESAGTGTGTATSAAQPGSAYAAAPATTPRPSGPVTIALGQSPEQVMAGKGQPSNKVQFPNKMVYIYPDMKITFVNGKVSDVQ